MTTPGGVPNLPQGALTLSNLASDLQDMSGTAMRSRAVQRFPNIFNNSTGLNPAVDLTPFGILTAIWAQVNSLIANADPADVQGPQDIPALVLQFIEGLPVVGQFIGLLEAILGTYAGTDPTLLQVKAIFAPIRAIVDALTAVSGGTGGLGNFFPDLLGVFGLGSSGLGTGSPTIPGVGSIPIFGPLFGLFGGASNSTQAGNFFTSITGLFGNPAGLLTGSPTVPALGSIPILGPVLGLFGGATSATQASNFFTNLLSLFGTPTLTGSTGSFNPATVLTSWINGSINPLNLLTTVTDFTSLLGSFGGATTTGGVNSFITNLLGSFGGATTTTGVNSFITNLLGSFGGATNLTQAGNFFTNLLSILNTPTLTGSPGSFNVNTAATNLINNVLNPTGLLASISAIVNAITGSAGTLPNLTAWMNDLTGLLGSPVGLGTGTPSTLIPFGNVAGIQGIIDVGTTAQNTWNSLATAFGGTLAAHNEAQQITVGDTGGGTVTSGTTVLDFQGQSTSALAYNATAATVQTALTALSTIGAGNLVASGGPLNTAPVTVTFQGTLANTPLPLIGHTDSLVGGTGPRATVSETVHGGNSVTLSDMTLLAQQQTANASGAINLSGGLSNILNIRDNKPGFAGLQRTIESTFNHVQLQGASPPATIGVTSTLAPMGLLRTQGADSKGIVEWLGNGSTNITTFKVNVYKMDQATGDLTLMHTSPDLHTSLSAAGTWTWTRYTFSGPNQTPVNAGDVLAAEFIVTGTGTHTIAAIPMTWVPTHPAAQLKSLSASRNPATLGASPTSIPAASIGWAGITAVPYVGFGITNFPANYQPPVTTQYATAGSYTYTIPSWAKVVGAKLNLAVLGSGGGGQANYGTLTWWTGGNAGTWATQTLVCGTDYPTTATSLAVVVGAKGLGAGGYWTNGHPGNISTVTWTDPSSTVHTITGNGGAGGGNAGTSGTNGKSPGNTTLDGTTYFGGTAVGGNATGSPPGGGGGGAGPYQTGGDAADGSVWIEAKQP